MRTVALLLVALTVLAGAVPSASADPSDQKLTVILQKLDDIQKQLQELKEGQAKLSEEHKQIRIWVRNS
jgi:phage shock protein A